MTPVFAHGRLRLYLLKLLEESPRHGYDVIRALEDRFLGLYSPSAGTVYPRLSRLAAEGLVVQAVQDGRKVYTITDAGRAELEARRGELDDLESDIAGSVSDLAEEVRSDVRGSVADLKDELLAAARDLRRVRRSSARTGRAGPPADPGSAASDDPAGRVRAELDGVLARLPGSVLTPAQQAELRAVLARAADDAARILGRPQEG